MHVLKLFVVFCIPNFEMLLLKVAKIIILLNCSSLRTMQY